MTAPVHRSKMPLTCTIITALLLSLVLLSQTPACSVSAQTIPGLPNGPGIPNIPNIPNVPDINPDDFNIPDGSVVPGINPGDLNIPDGSVVPGINPGDLNIPDGSDVPDGYPCLNPLGESCYCKGDIIDCRSTTGTSVGAAGENSKRKECGSDAEDACASLEEECSDTAFIECCIDLVDNTCATSPKVGPIVGLVIGLLLILSCVSLGIAFALGLCCFAAQKSTQKQPQELEVVSTIYENEQRSVQQPQQGPQFAQFQQVQQQQSLNASDV